MNKSQNPLEKWQASDSNSNSWQEERVCGHGVKFVYTRSETCLIRGVRWRCNTSWTITEGSWDILHEVCTNRIITIYQYVRRYLNCFNAFDITYLSEREPPDDTCWDLGETSWKHWLEFSKYLVTMSLFAPTGNYISNQIDECHKNFQVVRYRSIFFFKFFIVLRFQCGSISIYL